MASVSLSTALDFSAQSSYQICSRCIMDRSDPEIEFNSQGVCNHCELYDVMVAKEILPPHLANERLRQTVEGIKAAGQGKRYDCIIGVSGGVDSTYVAYLVKKLGLRPLAVHLDNGWNSELAVSNIQKTLEKLGIELYTHVIDWEEFKDLQLSFLKASTPDSEIPSDHAIMAIMRKMAKKMGVRTIISGCNVRTESHLPAAWSRGHSDWRYIKSVHSQFGSKKLKTYPHLGWFSLLMYQSRQRWVDILNFVEYRKDEALKVLQNELGWKYYGGKHYESIYTRFYQGVILPEKFGFDKRRAHLSSLICSGEISRAQALQEMQSETYPQDLREQDLNYVIKKFGLSKDEWRQIMALPQKTYHDYPNSQSILNNPIVKSGIRIAKHIVYSLRK